jgi:hypothetical protein
MDFRRWSRSSAAQLGAFPSFDFGFLDTKLAGVVGKREASRYFFIPLLFVGLFFKWDISVSGVVIAEAPKVGQIVAEIDEIETRDPVSIYLLLVNQLVPEQRGWDFGGSGLEENRSSYNHSVVTPHERQLENPVSVSDAANLSRWQRHRCDI